jgi:hypothetical protein
VLSSILSFLIKKDFIKKWGTFFFLIFYTGIFSIIFFDSWNFNKNVKRGKKVRQVNTLPTTGTSPVP